MPPPSSASPLRRHANLAFIVGLCATSALACFALKGTEGLASGLGRARDLALLMLPVILPALLLAGLVQAGVARERITHWLGANSGTRGLVLATLAGIATPGGPMAAFPLVLALAAGGADRGALVAFISAWALNGFSRILVWEIPVLGPEFAALRFVASLPLPLLAGMIARRLPGWATPQ
ncbi:permease [Elioraea sp.]|uniref:permease n=1 Tax=Elioraea sp. TaxID=2185103 RepID=UPI003F721DA6